MPLTPEQIKQLLAMPQTKPRGRKPKGYIDTSVRDVLTWFKLGIKMVDENTQELEKCENPDCTDTRPSHLVAEVNGKKMCRRCFLSEWNMEAQTELVPSE